MSRIGERLAVIGRRGHISETRIYELSVSAPTAPPAPSEQAHLDACARCRGLVEGHRRAEAVLSGEWTDRPLRSGTEPSVGIGRAGPVRVGRLSVVRLVHGETARRGVATFGAVAILIGVVVGAGLLQLRGSGQPAAGGSPTATLGTPAAPVTPAGTGVVARLPIGQYGSVAWSPDGAHLLVTDDSGSRVYDRFGKLVSTFGQSEGWLDVGHLISGDGYVADISASHTGGPTSNSWVVASGQGSAAIIVVVPGCTGDPMIDWYKNGQYVKAGEKVTPFGWSPDGKLVLLGHMDCSSQDAELNGWKGSVDIVDFASRRVLATAPAVRGAIAFNPSATRLAAESDGNLEIVDIATGKVHTVPGARLLGWSDDNYVYSLTAAGSLARIGATAETPAFNGIVVAWTIASFIGVDLVVDTHGAPTRIMAADGKATVLDLAPENLGPVRDLGEATSMPQPRLSALLRSPWSPDGRMLALKSSDGTSLVLISVDPALIRPGVGP